MKKWLYCIHVRKVLFEGILWWQNIFLEHYATFVRLQVLTQTDPERTKWHSSDGKSSELFISATILMTRGTPGP